MENLKRRDFIRTGSILTGAAALAATPVSRIFAAGSDEIKIALIGCGDRGTGAVFQALQSGQNVKLVALADPFRDRLDEAYSAAKQKFGDKVDVPDSRKYGGFDGYKAATRDADVVILTAPPAFRPAHFAEAVRQNRHMFMEKPVAVDAPGIRSVLASAEEAKRKKLNVVVGLQRHYRTCYVEGMKRVHDGAVGDIVSGQVYWNGGTVWCRPRKPGQTEMEYQVNNWNYFYWLSGDHIVEQHVHNIDVANWAKGKYPVSIQGTGSRALRHGSQHGQIYDNFSVEMTYDDGAVIYSQCRQIPGVQNRINETFQGTKGSAYFTDFGKDASVLKDWRGRDIYHHDATGDPNPYQVEHDILFAAVAKGEYKFADAENAARSTMAAIMGRIACYTGKVIKLDEAMKSNISLMPDRMAFEVQPKVQPGADGEYPVAVPGINTERYI